MAELTKEYFDQHLNGELTKFSKDIKEDIKEDIKSYVNVEVGNLAGMVKREFDAVNQNIKATDTRLRVQKLEADMSNVKKILKLP